MWQNLLLLKKCTTLIYENNFQSKFFGFAVWKETHRSAKLMELQLFEIICDSSIIAE
jgi:hypothetical protein